MTLLKKKVISLIAAGAMVITAFSGMTVAASAETASADATVITSLSQITDMAGDYVLGDSVTIDASAWTPIGTEAEPFTGSLDGDGYTVTWTGSKTLAGSYFGIFGLSQGTVSDLTVAGTLTVTGSGNSDYVSPVVAYNAGQIENVTNNAALTETGCYNIAGIAGFNAGTVTDCTNNGVISSDSPKAGGIAGFQNALSRTENCTNTGCPSWRKIPRNLSKEHK